MRRMEDRVRKIELIALAVGAVVLLVLFAVSRFR